MGIAREMCEKVQVGAVGTCTSGVSGVPGLDAFQAVVTEFQALEAGGLIEIIDLHRESHTGYRHVDLVRFRRMR
jgi:hypothetical protein